MKILLILLMIILQGTHIQAAPNPQQSTGFSVETRDESAPDIEQEFFIDMASLHDLPIDTVSIKDSEGKPDREWIGINLCLILEKRLNIACRQIKKISITAPDGYVSVISGELISALETGLCAFRLKGETNWPKKYGYMRLLFPDLRAMYWVNSPSKMIIELGNVQQASAHYSFYFLENESFASLIKKDVKDNPYLATDDLLFNLDAARQSFRILTQDSLFREYGSNDINRRLVLQQESSGTWKMTGIAVPLGLKTRKIFLLATQKKAIFLKSLSAPEQEIFRKNYIQNILKNLPDADEIFIELVLRDGDRVTIQKLKPLDDAIQNLYRTIEQQRQIYKNIDHAVLNIGSN